MGHLSRKYARESKRDKKLMEQYQPPGAYQEGERKHNEALAKKRELRYACAVTSSTRLGKL